MQRRAVIGAALRAPLGVGALVGAAVASLRLAGGAPAPPLRSPAMEPSRQRPPAAQGTAQGRRCLATLALLACSHAAAAAAASPTSLRRALGRALLGARCHIA